MFTPLQVPFARAFSYLLPLLLACEVSSLSPIQVLPLACSESQLQITSQVTDQL